MRAMLGMPVLEFPTPLCRGCRWLPAGGAPRARRLQARAAPQFRPGSARAVHGRRCHVRQDRHVCPRARPADRDACRRNGGRGGAKRGALRPHAARAPRTASARPGPASSRSTACISTPADIELLATHGGHVVHCPASNMKLGSGIAPVTALLAKRVNVALGTDGAASNNRLDLFGEMRLAALLAKVAGHDASVLPAHDVLRCATLGGARALGLESTLGSLVPGKHADIVGGRPRGSRRAALLRSRVASRSCDRPRRRDRRVGRRPARRREPRFDDASTRRLSWRRARYWQDKLR